MKNTPLLIWKKLANAHTDTFLFKSHFFAFQVPLKESITNSPATPTDFIALNICYTKTFHATFLAHNHSPLALAT